MQSTIQDYNNKYAEEACLGRGAFGQAMLASLRSDPSKKVVAKKVILEGLGEREKQNCISEANLLKHLQHPNIVSFIESYISEDQLIIVLEYCEGKPRAFVKSMAVGDLNYHVRRKTQKKEHFSELEVFNWFVQICLAMEYTHARKIIHRDIKLQNIFLTGNNTVKVGDFGISRVLGSTVQQASTVIGTPYYMSPEACQSQPYTSKSDMWALGCILYELCTFQKAFHADNLLGIVFKIVSDPAPTIPPELPYSPGLKMLVKMLLEKDPKLRPSAAQILQMNMVKQKMLEFVEHKGQTLKQGS